MTEENELIVEEIQAKNVLVKSKLADYCVNPYSGCGHACSYCYVPAMPWNRMAAKRPGELPWGKKVRVKLNAAEILAKELKQAKKNGRKGKVMLCSATDGWQPIEAKYKITRKCLEVLAEADWPISILTKSDLIVRDIDLLKRFTDATVGLTISTDREEVARILEPSASSPEKRIAALAALKAAGIKTYAFIGPLLPMNTENLVERLAGKINFAFIDRLNYASPKLKQILEANGWQQCLEPEWQQQKKKELALLLRKKGIVVEELF